MKRIDVAVGIVVRDGQVLICRRNEEGSFAGYWEFPGGKCEPGEQPKACVVRELREELGFDARPTVALEVIDHEYPNIHIRLHPFMCVVNEGEPQPIACAEMQWIVPARLTEFRFPDANEPLLLRLISALS